MTHLLYLVHTAIEPEKEDAFNEWYNTKHCVEMLQCDGVLSAARYRLLDTAARFPDFTYRRPHAADEADRPYLAAYQFADGAAFDAWFRSEERVRLREDHEARFPQRIPPKGGMYEQLLDLRRG
jgi:antibiotic biosynthesis monooxygenase (ABM) superfamily enzyme